MGWLSPPSCGAPTVIDNLIAPPFFLSLVYFQLVFTKQDCRSGPWHGIFTSATHTTAHISLILKNKSMFALEKFDSEILIQKCFLSFLQSPTKTKADILTNAYRGFRNSEGMIVPYLIEFYTMNFHMH